MAGDSAEYVYLDPGAGESGQSGVPEVVAAQVFVTEFGDDVVPVGCVTQDCGGDASASGTGEQAGGGVRPGGQEALGDEGADLLDDGDLGGPLALGALVGQPAGCGCGLAPYGPDPLVGVDVPDAAARELADPRGRARGEDDHVSPAAVLVVRGGHERVGQRHEGLPVGQSQRPWVVEFVLGLFVEFCQPVIRAGLTLMRPSRTACSMTRTRTAMVFFTVERLSSSAIQCCTVRSIAPLVIMRTGTCPRAGTTRCRHPER